MLSHSRKLAYNLQVQKMFGGQTLPLGRRLVNAVDEVMMEGWDGDL